jgi:O-antigen ligase
MAILLFVLFLIFFTANKFMEYRWQVTVLMFSTLFCAGLFLFSGNPYMENRLFSKEVVTDSKRIERWNVSYEMFREHPFFGVGYARVKPLRKAKYIEKDFPLAAASDYNAHNQFLEYLNSNGALGGFLYVIALFYLLLSSIHRRETLFTFLFFAFIVANLTESMMVRIKGIEYFAIFATLFLCGTVNGKQQSNEYLYNTRLRAIFRTGKWNP